MTNNILTPSFHIYYSKQLNQLPRSIKIDIIGVSAGKRNQIDKKIFFEIINVMDKMIKSTSILLRNFFLKKIEELLDLQEQYKSREVAMTRSLEESSGKVTQLSESVAFFKSIIPDTRKAIASAEKSIDLLKNKCGIWRILFPLRIGKLSLL